MDKHKRYTKLNDESLVRYLRKHPDDQAGWEAFLQRYERLIHSRIPNWVPDASDLHQEIQLAIWDGVLNRYSGKGTVLSYVGNIIVNQVRWSKRLEIRESLEADYEQLAENRVDEMQPPPLQKVIREEAGIKIEGLLQRFNPKERKMLILQYFGYRHKEICPLLGILSEGASRTFLSKLLSKVRETSKSLKIDAPLFAEGMRKLCEEGKLHEMLTC
jgi:RNA polymerase sigma factor (sigma-70 family)